ncbi:site-specific integrase [Paenibacillus sp. S3N08]|uniref:Site-specific integrase n=2 Tax=Paenibacillus agricola TaxID=2716264 RepID=A0ABX0JJ35_9BACL|nr:site-specific integrase [Paenibacillus agricola]
MKTYQSASKADNTRKSYKTNWHHFEDWCEQHRLPSLPTNEETYGLYLTALANSGYKASTISRRMSTIATAHELAGHASPNTKNIRSVIWAGIRRLHGVEEKGKQPIVLEVLLPMLAAIPNSLLGARDRAMVLLGFAGAFRRSELVGLDVEDIGFVPKGLVVNIRRSKTDQEGKGQSIGIPRGTKPETCPVTAYQAWIEAAGLTSGPVFRPMNRHGAILPKRLSDRAVARVVKIYAAAAGLDETEFAGHSLRSGLATVSWQAGKSERAIMVQTRHTTVASVRKYIRPKSLFIENAADGIGL